MSDLAEARTSVQVTMILFGAFGGLAGLLLLVGIAGTIHDVAQGGRVPVAALIALPIALLVAAVFGVLAGRDVKRFGVLTRMTERPIVAWGTLGAWQPTGTRINKTRLYDIGLSVSMAGHAPYAASALWFFPADLSSVMRPGARVVVLVDPEDASNVIVDWDRTRASFTPGFR